MQIVGDCIYKNKQYVVFKDLNCFKITNGFHDNVINEKNMKRHKYYKHADKQDIDFKKIINHMRGTRPWHPLLNIFRKEGVV